MIPNYRSSSPSLLYTNYLYDYSISSMKSTQPRSSSTQFQGLEQFYKECSQANRQMGDTGQSVEEFLAMKGIQPNELGTGRISFADVKRIQCLFIGEKKVGQTKSKEFKRYSIKIAELLQNFLNIPTDFLDYQLKVGKSSIQDPHRNLQYSFQRNKSRLNALKILDLLTQYKAQSSLLIAFIQSSLHENGDDVYGRACGDGVAVIDFNMLKHDKQEVAKFYETFLHQTLHTLGFDHCLSWTCLMNPIVAGDLWLCPNCLVKLQSQLSIEIEEWAVKVVEFFKKEICWDKALIKKSDKILTHLRKKKLNI